MIERQRRVNRRRAAVRSDERFPPLGADHRPLDGGQLSQHVGDLRALIERLAAVDVALGGDQDARLDLPESIEHPLDAEVRRARRPDRADRRRAEHRDDRLGNVREVRGHAIAGLDTRRPQRRREGRDLGAKLPP